jgi:hypothetical protein
MRTVADTEIEVFQSWGDPGAFNVWQGRVRDDARKRLRQEASRRDRSLSPAPVSLTEKAQ